MHHQPFNSKLRKGLQEKWGAGEGNEMMIFFYLLQNQPTVIIEEDDNNRVLLYENVCNFN
jgi:hypothetical protein